MSKQNKIHTVKTAIIIGLFWGLGMFIYYIFLSPLLWSDPYDFSTKKIVISLITWIIGGLLFGFTLRYFNNKKIQSK